MAVYKCKMCGGDLEIIEGTTVAECEYCGSRQTVPASDDEKKIGLFNRANRLRMKSEFDKAASIYENIIAEFPEEAEAYWCLCLCSYGIEYVDDSATQKKIPTCHRASFEKLTEDENYKLALEYADVVSQKIYRDEAREIDRIMGEILSISKNEQPYDIFICYKETDDSGERTADSVLAYDIYEALSAKGYKVFFSRVTLEDKLGMQYEPYIFAALNSAKIMLSIGTKYEYYHAVWVKNEWSRFLKLMAKDKSKVLIPCYKDIDAYDMPDEFKGFQAQNMGKLGAMQDLLRGIGKIMSEDKAVTTVKKTVVVNNGAANAEPLLRRAFMFLEDGEWSKADEFCEQVLNLNPECAKAYLGKLMAELKVRKQENLKNCAQPFDGYNNYQKTIKFADKNLADKLRADISFINDRNEETRKSSIYNYAVGKMNSAKTEFDFKAIAEKLKSISGYKDADSLAKKCLEEGEKARKEKIYNDAVSFMRKNTVQEYKVALENFELISGWRDADQKIDECRRRIEEIEEVRKEKVYNYALSSMRRNTIKDCKAALNSFASISGWRDADEKTEECRRKIEELKANQRREQERIAQEKRIASEKRKTIIKKILKIAVPVVASLISLVIILNSVIIPSIKYNKAVKLMKEEKYSEAILAFIATDSYKDSEEKISDCKTLIKDIDYNSAVSLMNDKEYIEAITAFEGLGGYKDSKSNIKKCFEYMRTNLPVGTISAGSVHTVSLKSDGMIVATKYTGSYYQGECDVSDWKNIVAVSAGSGHTVGLKSDGTVVAVGNNDGDQCDVKDWKEIVAVSAENGHHTIGLKSDGKVVAVGWNNCDQCNISDWKEIIAVSTGGVHTVGLKSDGTVIAVGWNEYGQCNVSSWKDIVAVSAGGFHTVGLKSDGTVIAVGENNYGQCDVNDWKDIVAVSAGEHFTVGLKSDGTVIATKYIDNTEKNIYPYSGQCDVEDWKDIVAISAGNSHTVGLKSDGTVVATTYTGSYYQGECDVEGWKDIKTTNK